MLNGASKSYFWEVLNLPDLAQGWPTRGPERDFCGPNSNRQSAIFRYFGCISSVFFCFIVAQKVNNFDILS
jgi:hypothetical protein